MGRVGRCGLKGWKRSEDPLRVEGIGLRVWIYGFRVCGVWPMIIERVCAGASRVRGRTDERGEKDRRGSTKEEPGDGIARRWDQKPERKIWVGVKNLNRSAGNEGDKAMRKMRAETMEKTNRKNNHNI